MPFPYTDSDHSWFEISAGLRKLYSIAVSSIFKNWLHFVKDFWYNSVSFVLKMQGSFALQN